MHKAICEFTSVTNLILIFIQSIWRLDLLLVNRFMSNETEKRIKISENIMDFPK